MKSLRAPVDGMDVTYTCTLSVVQHAPRGSMTFHTCNPPKPTMLSSMGTFWVGLGTPAFAPHLKLNVILHSDWVVNLSTIFTKRFYSNFTFGPGMHVCGYTCIALEGMVHGAVQWVRYSGLHGIQVHGTV